MLPETKETIEEILSQQQKISTIGPKEYPYYPAGPLETAMQYVLPLLEKGRKDWDVNHTKAVFYYSMLLAKSGRLNPRILGIAAILHDVGYFGLFNGIEANHQSISASKTDHIQNGIEIATLILNRPDIRPFFSQNDKREILRLVRIHDQIPANWDRYHQALFEADSLGAIDPERSPKTFDKEGCLEHLANFMEKRVPFFRTPLGCTLLDELLPKYQEDISTMGL